jgi:hypothetical protein
MKAVPPNALFMAMAIGDDPGMQVLDRFISQPPVLAEVNGNAIRNSVFHAADADGIHDFSRKVTMLATIRSGSQNPHAIPTSTTSGSSEEDGGNW